MNNIDISSFWQIVKPLRTALDCGMDFPIGDWPRYARQKDVVWSVMCGYEDPAFFSLSCTKDCSMYWLIHRSEPRILIVEQLQSGQLIRRPITRLEVVELLGDLKDLHWLDDDDPDAAQANDDWLAAC